MAAENKLAGVVLSGGLSTRMGQDKGLLQTGAIPWFLRQRELLLGFCCTTVVSIREEQFYSYSRFLNGKYFVTDSADFQGPVAGILSAHKKFPTHDLFVLSCDLQAIGEKTLDKLYKTYQNSPESGFIGLQSDYGIEPLAGIYRRKALEKLLLEYDNNSGLVGFLKNTGCALIAPEEPSEIKNFNTPDSLTDEL